MDGLESVSSVEMTAIEMNAEYFGVSTLQMMENAGSFAAREISSLFKPGETRVVVFAGTGGNGGDGLVAARHLAGLGYRVEVVLVGKPEEIRREIVRRNWEAVKFMDSSVKRTVISDSSLFPMLEGEVIVDALLGTGAKGALKQPVLQAVRVINGMKGFKVALDLPTGVDADSGEAAGEAVKADLTITFHRVKNGLLKAKEYVGELVVADIGVPREAETCVGPGDVLPVRRERLSESHKGDFGHLLVIGGSETYSGAPALAAMAAMRVGVDLVYLAAPHETAHDIASFSPSLITIKLEGDHLAAQHVSVVKGFIEKSSAVVLGPGLGLHKETVEAVKELLEVIEKMKIPLLLDADGLKAFAQYKRKMDVPMVLTPHAGEYKILTGVELPAELEGRMEHVRKTAEELDATILLKGPVDIVSDGVRVKLNRVVHNPGMTVGGTGDVLSGLVGAFLSQGFKPFESAVAGVFVNGACGDFVAHEKGFHMLPTDIVEWIPKVMDDPMSHIQVRRLP